MPAHRVPLRDVVLAHQEPPRELSFDVEELLRNDVGGLHPKEGGSGALRRLPRQVWEATVTLQFNLIGLRFVGPHICHLDCLLAQQRYDIAQAHTLFIYIYIIYL
ncbi:hypothetical protein BHE74_00033079 [Ensete ventricosum]|nr:hypothetical protein BHE74_00033079 [Ensete ventricosum]